jgi:hypothetical protein
MLTPNIDQAVTTLPKIASTAMPRCLTMPPQRACSTRAQVSASGVEPGDEGVGLVAHITERGAEGGGGLHGAAQSRFVVPSAPTTFCDLLATTVETMPRTGTINLARLLFSRPLASGRRDQPALLRTDVFCDFQDW